MKLFTWMQDTVQYLFDGDDDYPKTGVQPFSGDPCDDPKKYSRSKERSLVSKIRKFN